MTENNIPKEPVKRHESRYSYFREFIIVIVGALIALAANDYQEASERQERDEQVLLMIQNELEANIQAIEKAGDYHERMIPLFWEAIEIFDNENRWAYPEEYESDQEVEAVSTAFELAVVSGTLSRISPHTALVLSKTYDELKNYDDQRNRINLATIQSSFTDGRRYLFMQRVSLEVEVEYKQTMKPLYEQALLSTQNPSWSRGTE